MNAPDPGWIPFVKILLGYLILFTLAALAAAIGFGRVEAGTSFGLDIILGGLLTLAGGFTSWCFARKEE